MRKVNVIENAEELVDLFSNRKGGSEPILSVGSIQNSWMEIDGDEFQVAPHITFEQLFLELCKRAKIPVKRVGSAK